MSNNKRLTGFIPGILCLTALLMGLSGCQSNTDASESVRYESAVQEGLIAHVVETEIKETDYELGEVTKGSLKRQFESQVQVLFPVRRELRPTLDGGVLTNIYVSVGNRVREGQVLADISFNSEGLKVERQQLMLRINQTERQYANENAQYLNNIARFKNNPPVGGDEIAMEIHALELRKMELSYERFQYQYEQTRQQQMKSVDDIDKKLQGEQIVAPFNGVVMRVTGDVRIGDSVNRRTSLITLYDESVYQLSMQGLIDVIRYGDTVEITDKEDFNMLAKVSTDPIVTNDQGSQFTYVLTPIDMLALDEAIANNDWNSRLRTGRSLTALAVAFDAEDLVLAPRAAIRSERKSDITTVYYVYIFEEGMIKKRYVQTGLVLEDLTEIITGLEPGQWVVLN